MSLRFLHSCLSLKDINLLSKSLQVQHLRYIARVIFNFFFTTVRVTARIAATTIYDYYYYFYYYYYYYYYYDYSTT